MSMIFPGMDPYLEHPAHWMGVHDRLIVYISDQMRPKLRPRYIAKIEQRVYLEAPDRDIRPDVIVNRVRRPKAGGGAAVAVAEVDAPLVVVAAREEYHESYLEIIDLSNGQKVVTVIEVLSPGNKVAGPARDSYRKKQREVLESDAHLVEIDLLRKGGHVLSVPEHEVRMKLIYDYMICVNRAVGTRDRYEIYYRSVRERIPPIAIPLADGDPDVHLDLQAALARTHDEGSYLEQIAYRNSCVPRLPREDQEWADELVAQMADVLPPE